MKKLSDPLCFTVSLEEVIKYGLSPINQLRKNPEPRNYLKERKRKELKLMSSKEIAERNDSLRKSIPNIFHPNLLVLTRGVADLGQEEVNEILKMVKEFNVFTKDNDPWKEHDFGAFECKGKKIFWKIDDYAGNEGYDLVLTIMLAEEY